MLREREEYMGVSQRRANSGPNTGRMPPGVQQERARISSHHMHYVYRLIRREDGSIRAPNTNTFSAEGYSLFKHGDERWARRYGYDIADLLMDAEPVLFEGMRSDEVLIAAFPYKYVPTAAALMTGHAVTRLNHELVAQGKSTVGYLHAFKYPWQASIEHHFPKMGEEDRRRILNNVELSVDEHRLRGANLIVVDDIRVTGATQDRFLQLFYRIKGLRSLTVVFLCDVDQGLARTNPAVENELNHARVKTLDDVADIVAGGEFRWNIRVTKFVLEQDGLESFGAFVSGLGDGLLLTLYRMITLNEYHLEPKYTHRVLIVHSAVEARGLV